jgi:GTP-binding protein
MESYFAQRASLSGLLIVVDARRGFGDRDEAMLGYAIERGIPSRVLLSKSDKLGRNEARQVLATTKASLAGRAGAQLFSATKGEGVDAAQAVLDEMLAKQAKKPGDP